MKTNISIAASFLAVFSFSIFIQFAYINILQPVQVYAAPVDDAKSNACKDKKEKSDCEQGFNEGFSGQRKPTGDKELVDACGIDPKQRRAASDGAKDQYSGCVAGYNYAKDNPSSASPSSGSGNGSSIISSGANSAADAGLDPEGEGGNDKSDQVDCDTKLSSILSWIICPLIDLGVGMSDLVFEQFISPMMENVPVSTDSRDGSFKAWQQFRIIANILLVGSLLMIVYSQAKGGGN